MTLYCIWLVFAFGVSSGLAFEIHPLKTENNNEEHGGTSGISSGLLGNKCYLGDCLNLEKLHRAICRLRCLASERRKYPTKQSSGLPRRRQIDPLHSCIEAKCARSEGQHYYNCIYTECIMGMLLGRRSVLQKKDFITDNEEQDSNENAVDSPIADDVVIRDGLRRVPKRSHQGISGLCITHNCGHLPGDSRDYVECLFRHCNEKR